VKSKDGFHHQLGHSDVWTTEIYTHVIGRGGKAVISPLEGIVKSKEVKTDE
jgi:integrase